MESILELNGVRHLLTSYTVNDKLEYFNLLALCKKYKAILKGTKGVYKIGLFTHGAVAITLEILVPEVNIENWNEDIIDIETP